MCRVPAEGGTTSDHRPDSMCDRALCGVGRTLAIDLIIDWMVGRKGRDVRRRFNNRGSPPVEWCRLRLLFAPSTQPSTRFLWGDRLEMDSDNVKFEPQKERINVQRSLSNEFISVKLVQY